MGVYFVTQSPADIPDSVLGQLGNRVQHALRAFTPSDQKAVRIAANTLRANPAFDAAGAITELGSGSAHLPCSTRRAAQRGGARLHRAPGQPHRPPERGRAPGAYSGLIALRQIRHPGGQGSPRSSGFRRHRPPPMTRPLPPQTDQGGGLLDALNGILFGRTGPRGGQHDGVVQTAAKSVARTLGNEVGRQLMRGVLGSLLGSSKRRR